MSELQQKEILDNEKELADILAERKKTHGDFETGALVFRALSREINAAGGKLDACQYYAAMAIALKLTRILVGNANEEDHWRDLAGYATLGGRLNK